MTSEWNEKIGEALNHMPMDRDVPPTSGQVQDAFKKLLAAEPAKGKEKIGPCCICGLNTVWHSSPLCEGGCGILCGFCSRFNEDDEYLCPKCFDGKKDVGPPREPPPPPPRPKPAAPPVRNPKGKVWMMGLTRGDIKYHLRWECCKHSPYCQHLTPAEAFRVGAVVEYIRDVSYEGEGSMLKIEGVISSIKIRELENLVNIRGLGTRTLFAFSRLTLVTPASEAEKEPT